MYDPYYDTQSPNVSWADIVAQQQAEQEQQAQAQQRQQIASAISGSASYPVLHAGAEALLGAGETTPTVAAADMTLPTSLTYNGTPIFANSSGGLMGLLSSPAVLGTGAVAGTIAGNELANRYGGDPGRLGWAAGMSMNPINQAYEGGRNVQNVLRGEKVPLSAEAALATLTGGASLLYNPVFGRGGMFGSSKGKDQVERDNIRSLMQDMGMLDENYQLQLPGGQSFDVGKDGGAMLEGGAYGGKRHYYDVNFDLPTSGDLAGAFNPLASWFLSQTGGSPERRENISGWFTNTAQLSTDPNQAIRDIYNKSGATHDQIYSAILGSGLDDKKRDAALAETDLLWGRDNPEASAQDTANQHANPRYGILKDKK